MSLHWNLFSLEGLPEDLQTFLVTCSDPVEAVAKLGEFVATLVQGQQIHGTVEEGALLHGNVHVGEGSVIHSGVVIEGPAYIGRNVSVRPHANIRHGAYLSDNCVIGHSADVKNTLALPGSKIQDGTFAGDSILGHKARLGSGAILANRKFNQTNIKISYGENEKPLDSGRDFLGALIGDQARLGANVISSPGTVIGPHTWVGSGVVLHGYIGPDQLVTVKQELDIRPKERTNLKAGKAITFDYL